MDPIGNFGTIAFLGKRFCCPIRLSLYPTNEALSSRGSAGPPHGSPTLQSVLDGVERWAAWRLSKITNRFTYHRTSKSVINNPL